jgi:hypothetical protein
MKPLVAILVTAMFLTPLVARAQSNPDSAPAGPGEPPPAAVIAQQSQSMEDMRPPGKTMVNTEVRVVGVPRAPRDEPREFGPVSGAWWKNSEIVSKLQLSDEQVKKISQTYLDHKLKLVDLRADLEKQELRLQPLLDVDQPDEGKVSAQIDLITSARGKLEKENALMMLAIRRWLSVEQWKKLQSLGGLPEDEGKPKVFFWKSLDAQPLPGDIRVGPIPAPPHE